MITFTWFIILIHDLISFNFITPNFDLQSMLGSYVSSDKSFITIIYPEYTIRVSDWWYDWAMKHKTSPYKFFKKRYHIVKDSYGLTLRDGPPGALGSRISIIMGNRLRTGNIFDHMKILHKTSDEEVWGLLESWGFDIEKIKELPMNNENNYTIKELDGELLYDSYQAVEEEYKNP